MKGNKKTYFLAFAVAIIWGLIGYQLYEFVNRDESYAGHKRPETQLVNRTDTLRTYELLANYRDPFKTTETKTLHRRPSSQSTSVASRSSPQAPPPADINWSAIRYQGVVENNDSRKKIALVSVQGRSSLIKEGDRAGDFTIAKIWKDSIKVLSGKHSKVLYRNK